MMAAYINDAALLAATREWGKMQGLRGNKGGWISKPGERSEYQGWFSVWAAHKAQILDDLTRRLTAFESFREMVSDTAPQYRPTIRPRTFRERVLADAYDMAQERRNDPRRAWRGSGA
jgi:hypothetical protein